MFITAKIAFILTSLSAFQIYDFCIFTAVYSPLKGFIWNQNRDQLPVGLLAQLVEHCTGIAEVMGSNPAKAWIFFKPSFHYYLSNVHNCEDRYHIHVVIRISNIHSCLFTTSRVYLEPTQCPASSWLVSSVGEALHPYRRGLAFKSCISPNLFFSGLLFTTA